MITIDRLSLPLGYQPQIGDLLVITGIAEDNRGGKWTWKMARVNAGVPKELIAWLLKRLNGKDAAELMLWCSTGKPLGGEG